MDAGMAAAVKYRARYDRYNDIPYNAYDGSAVRQLPGEEVLQPRPLVRPKERVVARPRIRVREAGQVSPFAVAGFLAVAVFALLLLYSYVNLTVISQQVVDLRSEMTELRSEEAKLRAQYELAYDLDSIESEMTANGTMVKPQNGQTIYVDLSEPDSVMLFAQEETGGEAGGFLEGIESIATEIVEYFQ